jgi:cell division cycle 20-like protein 1, cofactor of APC complex
MTSEGLAVEGISDRPQTPDLNTPPLSKTPPTIPTRRSLGNVEIGSSSTRVASEAMEADALSRRLKELENAGRPRDRTPGRSPSRKRQRVYGDR